MSDHYSGLHEGLAEAEELHQRMLECVDVRRVLMLQKLASGRYAFALERPTMTMPRYVVGTTNVLNDEPHVNGCFVLEAAAMAAFQRDYGVSQPLGAHGAVAAPCVMLAALNAPAWLVVMVILVVLCTLAIQAARALECWSDEREAEHDKDGAWHVKRHAPDPRRSGRD
jgi:hypothetical protein